MTSAAAGWPGKREQKALSWRASRPLSPLGKPSRASFPSSLAVSIKPLTLESSFPFVSSVLGHRNMASSALLDCSSPATARLIPFRRSVQSRTFQFQRSVSIAWRPLNLTAVRSAASSRRSLAGTTVHVLLDSTLIQFRC